MPLFIHCKKIQLIIIERKEGENIDRMVKRYKRKHRNIQVIRELRKRKHFIKKSVVRRHEILDAKYRRENYESE
jgi:small subunit ribosomal protein S21